MQVNAAVKTAPTFTHEGAPAARGLTPLAELRRSVLACLLWEGEFYEAGAEIAARIRALVHRCDATDLMALAIEARHEMHLRHAPLLVAREMARHPDAKRLVAHTLAAIVDRPDELGEFLAIYWADGKDQPVSAQVKKGLARAFAKFGEHQLAKYDGERAVKLRDALFVCHARPADAPKRRNTRDERKAGARLRLTPGEELYRRVAQRELAVPDTWEVALSAGQDKRETFVRLIAEKKLGGLALLRNLRGMQQAGVPRATIAAALAAMSTARILPFRFLAAARAAPGLEDLIEPVMLACAADQPKLPGRTALLVDVSGSMDHALSGRSELRRVDAACGLAVMGRELCDEVAVFTFSERLVAVPPRRGFALGDAIIGSQPHLSTMLGAAVTTLRDAPMDRLIVITDEQAHDRVPSPAPGVRGYVVNVASAKNGVGYGAWTHLDGFSERLLGYIAALEREPA